MSDRHPNGSETQEGPDWWLASDNRWYPPELHPEFRNARSVIIGDRGSDPEYESSPSLLAGPGLDGQNVSDAANTTDSATDPGTDTDPGIDAGSGIETVPGLLGASTETAGGEIAGEAPESGAADPSDDPDANLAADEVRAVEPQVSTAEPGPSGTESDVTDTQGDTGSDDVGGDAPGVHSVETERPHISIGTPLPESSAQAAPPVEDSSAVVNPWTLPVRGRFDSEAVTAADPDGAMAASSSHRIVLPGELESDPSPQSIRPSGPTPVAKSLTFRPAEPTTVQAAVSVPTADDTPWYQRSVDGSEPAPATTGQNTPNIYGGALSVAGGALAVVGALMTWATETGPLLDGFLWARKVPGFASNGGWVLVCGLLMGVAGVLSIIGVKPTGVWSIMSIVSGGLVLAAVLYSYADIVGAASEDWRTFVSASTGIDAVTLKARGVGLRPAFGLWLSAIAGLLGCGAGIYFKRDF